MLTIDGGTGKLLYNVFDIASRIMIDQWRRAASLNLSSGENYLTSYWERVDTAPQGACIPGGGMTESSGVFTFPKTGLYKVTLDLAMLTSGASQDNYANVRIELSTNSGGAFTTLKEVITGGIQNLASGHSGHVFINVTDASTFRVRFQTASLGSGSTVRGNAANSNAYTTVSFERLTDAQS